MRWRRRTSGPRGRSGRTRAFRRLVAVTAVTVGSVTAVTAAFGGTAAAAGGADLALVAGSASGHASAGSAGGYAFAEDARRVDGADGTADATPLEAGVTYRSSLARDARAYYGLELDAASDAYVSVTAVPRPGEEVVAVDGVRVSVQDADGGSCSLDSATFGAARSPRPVTAWGAREITRTGTRCQDPGRYYVVVERVRPQDSPPDAWDLELTTVSEPAVKGTAATDAPQTWDSASPAPLTGEPENRPGGAGFADAASIGPGAWRADAEPGQTLYYKVPLDWGRQLYATAELGGADGRSGYATGALSLSLLNPVRGQVDSAGTGYTGRRATVDLGPVPPVAYGNRYAVAEEQSAMRFAGSYYLVVHLAEQVADRFGDGPFEVVLRVRLTGAERTGPDYAGEPVPRGVFEATEPLRAAASDDAAGSEAGSGAGDGAADPAMRAVAVGGIGTGSVLLAGLGVWTVVARRRGA
ncbi:hypothetical protein [Streptomyces sp. NPDC090994]|uniref:hypothetical protein n=1 Tax=Streptomyces sp. NPDC090994 TaxID=3365969 RepID=UPI0037FE7E6B